MTDPLQDVLDQPDADGARALAASATLTKLGHLGLGGGNYTLNEIGEAGIEALAKSTTLRNLRDLHLQANEFTHDGFVYLSVADLLDTVESLDLSHNGLSARSVESLILGAPPQIHTLWLYGNPVEDGGARMLAACKWARQLRELNLASTRMTDAGAAKLLASEHLDGLEHLRLAGNDFSPEMVRLLRERFGSAALGLPKA